MKGRPLLGLLLVVVALVAMLGYSGALQSQINDRPINTPTTAPAAPAPTITVPAVTLTASELDRLLENDAKQVSLVVFQNGSNDVLVFLKGATAPQKVTYVEGSKEALHKELKRLDVPYEVRTTRAEASDPAAPTNPQGSPGFFASIPAIVWMILGVIAFFVVLNWIRKRQLQQQQRQNPRRPGTPPQQNNEVNRRGQLDSSFTRSAARKFEPTGVDKTFKDVAGCDEAIRKLQRVLKWLKPPGWFTFFGARLPKGVLLVGPPGTGKTLLAKALAGEAGASFYSIAGSQFVEIYVGVGASRVRDLFNEARNEVYRTQRPVIIFIDEIDAVGRQRGGGPGASNDEREQTLNQVLVEMDGFAPNQGILVLAATNRADILDAALKRPGRFDYQVMVDLPDAAGREAIYGIHTRGKPLAKDMDMKLLAARTPGFSGADIEAVCNEAATLAAERVEGEVAALRKAGKTEQEVAQVEKAITLAEFDEAVDVVQMGEARTSRAQAMSLKDMAQTAYHEVGHAAVAHVRGGDPITKITIVPRARALGYTQALPEGDRFNMTEQQLKTRIMMAMGGRIAQEVFLNTVDTGAGNDFKQASGIAWRMVTEFGMSQLGHLHIEQDNPYQPSMHGPELNDAIDREWKRILKESYDEAKVIIEQNRDRIEHVTKVLLQKETLLGPEFRKLWDEAGGAEPTAPTTAEPIAQ